MITVEEIHALYKQRKQAQGPVIEQMRRVKELANGDTIIPLNELDKAAKTSVANLLVQGLDQTSMRIASTFPTPYFPPLIESRDRSKQMANTRRKAMQAMWDHNRLKVKMRRRARHLLAYSTSPVVIKPDFQNMMPTWSIRNPLDTFPCPSDDPDNPVPYDCIFTYSKPLKWLLNNYGYAVDGKLRLGRISPDTRYTIIEYVSPDEIVICAVGAEDAEGLDPVERWGASVVELERIANRSGMPLAVVPQRITLDKQRGQFDGLLGMYYTRARLQALTEIAIERGIFPDEYLVARPGDNPEIIQIADGKTGQLGIVRGGDIQQLNTNPGYKTDIALDRLERQERLEGAIPAEFGGESGTNIRTGRRGENVLAATVDFRVQESQSIFEASLVEEDKIAIAIEKAYWGNKSKSFFISGRANVSKVDYVPNKIWETDFHYVSYPASGSDINSLIIGIGQRLGIGTMSKESAREVDPLISDPELEADRITSEGVEAALLSSIQQQAADPNGPYQPADLAYLVKLVKEDNLSLYEAVEKTNRRAQERQATPAPTPEMGPEEMMAGMGGMMPPEAMPGLATPGMGAEQPMPPAQGPAGPPELGALLSQLRGA
jgi:hypothetical protein